MEHPEDVSMCEYRDYFGEVVEKVKDLLTADMSSIESTARPQRSEDGRNASSADDAVADRVQDAQQQLTAPRFRRSVSTVRGRGLPFFPASALNRSTFTGVGVFFCRVVARQISPVNRTRITQLLA